MLDGRHSLVALACAGPVFCLAVDALGETVVRSPAGWAVTSAAAPAVTGLSCGAPDDCWAVVRAPVGILAHYSDGVWQQGTVPFETFYSQIDCPSPFSCFALGDDGTVFQYDGSAWTRGKSPLGSWATGLSCPSTSYCLVTGSGRAEILRWGHWYPADAGPSLTSPLLNCWRPGLCLAVDSAGRSSTYY